MSNQNLLQLVSYCGLYCDLCAQRARIPPQAQRLQQIIDEEKLDDLYEDQSQLKAIFPQFWQFLQALCSFDCHCRTKTGNPRQCEIRNCAQKSGIEVCPQCKEYPCHRIRSLAERYPTLIQDGMRMQKIGIEKWVYEQKERAKRGFCYSDLRHPR